MTSVTAPHQLGSIQSHAMAGVLVPDSGRAVSKSATGLLKTSSAAVFLHDLPQLPINAAIRTVTTAISLQERSASKAMIIMRHFALVSLLVLVLLNCPAQHTYRTTSRNLPEAVLKVLASDEKQYCETLTGIAKQDCHQTFGANLRWQEMRITPAGQVAILLENDSACGPFGCTLKLFEDGAEGRVVQILGSHGDVGSLRRTEVLKSTTKGHFDLRLTSIDGETVKIYRWHRFCYVVQPGTKNVNKPEQ